ncbi:MAG: hypothetical protein HAW63_05715 [Bdellovibrionaceae bacterium]|nr:hypothetical protein [Pseudobdellovibrionaceae bacterium]
MNKYSLLLYFFGSIFLSSCSTASWVSNKAATSKKQVTDRRIDQAYLKEQSSYHYLLTELSSLQGKDKQSLLQIKNTLLYDNGSLPLKIREVELFLEHGDLSKGIDRIDVLLQAHPNEPSLLGLKAVVYEALGSYKAAEKIYKVMPKSDEVLFAQVRLAFLQKHFQRVVKLAKKVRFKEERFLSETQYYLAQSLEAQKKWKQAEKVYKNSLNSGVNAELFLLFALADFYKKQKKTKKELGLLLKYKDRVAETYLVLQRLFTIYVEKEETTKALAQAESLLGAGAKGLGFQFQVSLLYIAEKQYKKATTLLEQILLTDPQLDRVQFYLGLMYKETQQFEKAKNTFAKIVIQSAYYQEATQAKYYLLIKEKNGPLLAEQFLKKSLTQKTLTEKTKKSLSYFLVLHYEEQKQFVKALDFAQKMIQVFPNFVDVLNYVAYKWADAGVHLKQAEVLATKAHQLEPNNVFVLDTLGWLFFKKGDYKQAKNYLELAYNKAPFLESAEHLADVYKHFNKLGKASRLYTRALRLAEAQEDKKRLKDKLSLLFVVKLKKKGRVFKAKSSVIESRQPSSVTAK